MTSSSKQNRFQRKRGHHAHSVGRPHVLIHCAANRFPDKCDRDPDGARQLNVEATQQLFQACVKHSTICIYISTDYVFPGRPGEAPYEADAETEPTNIYGRTKLDGESAALEATADSGLGVVLRVPVLYGKADSPSESAVNVLLDAVWNSQKEDASLKMDHWARRYPTNTEDVARVCFDTAVKYLHEEGSRKQLPRVLQFSSEERLTKYEMCEILAELLGLPLENVIADAASPTGGVQRPFDTHLSTKALKDIGIETRTQDFKAWWLVFPSWSDMTLSLTAIGNGNSRRSRSDIRQTVIEPTEAMFQDSDLLLYLLSSRIFAQWAMSPAGIQAGLQFNATHRSRAPLQSFLSPFFICDFYLLQSSLHCG